MPRHLIQLGVIGRAHGVRGLVRVSSHTAEPTAMTEYGLLSDAKGRDFTLRWVSEGVAEVSEIVGGRPVKVSDRAAAERLTNTRLFIERDRLPPPETDEFYIADLVGLTAVARDGSPLGVIAAVHDYGGGTSIEIERENGPAVIVPFTADCVPDVDIAAGRATVLPPDEVDVSETREEHAA